MCLVDVITDVFSFSAQQNSAVNSRNESDHNNEIVLLLDFNTIKMKKCHSDDSGEQRNHLSE